MLYITPRKQLSWNVENDLRIQIDNSRTYWKDEDIILITNFPYEYDGKKAMVVNGDLYCKHHDKASKVNVFLDLLNRGILKELTWFHDLDAFQMEPLDDLKLEKDIGFTDYGWNRKWNTGSIFFKPTNTTYEVFKRMRDAVYYYETDEERAFMKLTETDVDGINSMYQRLNITYNFGMRRVAMNIANAAMPVKVVHFHPHKKGLIDKLSPVLTDKLVNLIYKHYGKEYFDE